MSIVRGIVAEVSGKSCILITPEGEFVRVNKVPRPAQVGEELEVRRSTVPWTRVALVAAVLLLSLVIPLYPMYTAMAQPVAYVSLDINPSLELGINKQGTVITTKAFNDDGSKLLQGAAVNKTSVYDAVKTLLDRALAEGYVADGKPNLVLAAYSGDFPLDPAKLQDVIKQEAEKAQVAVHYVVLPATAEIHKKAQASNVSQGKYLVFADSAASGQDVSLEDLQKEGINKALHDKGLKVEDVEPGVSHYRPDDQTKPAEPKDQVPPDKGRKPDGNEHQKDQSKMKDGSKTTNSKYSQDNYSGSERSKSGENGKHD